MTALILIVDDHADNRNAYASVLEHFGYEVATAGNGKEALDRARLLRPDLILMDLSMPVMDGFEATERLKDDEATRRIPVVAVTAHDGPGFRRRASEVGMKGYLAKPCLPMHLLREVELYVASAAPADRSA